MELGGFILAVVGTLIAVIVFVSIALIRSRKRIWARFARRHGLRYEHGTPARIQVDGTVQGRAFRLFTPDASSDSGELGIQEVQMRVGLHGRFPAAIRTSRVEGWVGAVDRMSDLTAVPTGDEQFDRKVFVQSQDAEHVRQYLTPARRESILKLVSDARTDDAGLDGSNLFIQDREMVASLDRIEERLQLMLSLAPSLDATES